MVFQCTSFVFQCIPFVFQLISFGFVCFSNSAPGAPPPPHTHTNTHHTYTTHLSPPLPLSPPAPAVMILGRLLIPIWVRMAARRTKPTTAPAHLAPSVVVAVGGGLRDREGGVGTR
jgi:hypothetical protein